MKNVQSRFLALLPGVAIFASAFAFSPAPVRADDAKDSKNLKLGAVALGALGVHLFSKGKEVEAAAALGGAYYAYKKGEDKRKEAKEEGYGWNREYNRDGYDSYGYNRDGYDRDGYNRDGYNRTGYNRDGYDRNGYCREGYNRDGYNRTGYDRNGLRRGERRADWSNDDRRAPGRRNGWNNPRNPHYRGR